MSSDPSDWKEQAFAAYLAQQKRNEAAERRRLAERGEISFELLLSEYDDLAGDEVRLELDKISTTLKSESVSYSQTIMALDGADAVGGPLPEYIIVLKTLATPAITALATVVAALILRKPATKARLRIGDVEAEMASFDEIKVALEYAKEYAAKAAEADKAPQPTALEQPKPSE
ncbi:hypothetical protein [Brevundimonas sp.]